MTKTLRSVNEKIKVEFNVEEHTYHYEGKQFFSASTFAAKYGGDDFDAERIAMAYSQKHDVDMDDVLDMWDSNGTIAAGYGTSIHAVMEHYYKYKEIGAKLQEATGSEFNKAMPNHPDLRNLIIGVEEVREDCESIQEAFVTLAAKQKCGQIDDLLIVDKKKKICKIVDYKITVDILKENKKLAAPFAYLGGSKLSKNFLQMAFYAYLMQASGWKVQSCDILNWNGHEWTKYTLDGPKLMKTMLLIANEI